MSIKIILSADGMAEQGGKQINNPTLAEINSIIATMEQTKLELIVLRQRIVMEHSKEEKK